MGVRALLVVGAGAAGVLAAAAVAVPLLGGGTELQAGRAGAAAVPSAPAPALPAATAPPGPAAVPPSGRPGARPVIPLLAELDRQIADRLVRGLPAFARGGDLANEGVWHVGPEKMGVSRVYTFPRPVDVPVRSWPTVRYVEGKGYVPGRMRYGVVGMTDLTVMVDTRTGRIAEVRPSGYTRLTGLDDEAPPPEPGNG